jgi:hypothetical protein
MAVNAMPRQQPFDNLFTQILFRSREQLAQLFAGFDDPCVLMHGNLRLASMLKGPQHFHPLAIPCRPAIFLHAVNAADQAMAVNAMP